jgi:2-keto-4-pentenoate hydratase
MKTDPALVIQHCAQSLRTAMQNRLPIEPIRPQLELFGEQAAYAVQQINTQGALAAGRRIVGRKIGLTSLAVQKQLGVDQPDYGALLDDMALVDGEIIDARRLIQPKVEGEIAFVMGRTLTQPNPSTAEVLRAVEYVLPAIEIVDSRIRDWRIGFLDTVADNASSGLFVVGNTPHRLEGLELRGLTMSLHCNNESVSSGSGANCLGHPVNALVWVARKLMAMGECLREGDLVMSGALGPMVPARSGDRFEVTIAQLGTVQVGFAAD